MLALALGVDAAMDGRAFGPPDFALLPGAAAPLLCGPRIGITRAKDRPWRWGLAGSAHLSRPFPGN